MWSGTEATSYCTQCPSFPGACRIGTRSLAKRTLTGHLRHVVRLRDPASCRHMFGTCYWCCTWTRFSRLVSQIVAPQVHEGLESQIMDPQVHECVRNRMRRIGGCTLDPFVRHVILMLVSQVVELQMQMGASIRLGGGCTPAAHEKYVFSPVSLAAQVVELQLQKLQKKLSHFEAMEVGLEKERTTLLAQRLALQEQKPVVDVATAPAVLI